MLEVQNDNDRRYAPVLDWRGMKPSDHFVQFYESDIALVDAVSGFIGAGLGEGEGCIVIATQPHRGAIEAKLKTHGLILAQTQGKYVALDAAETLSCIMVAGSPEPHCFRETVAARARPGSGRRAVCARLRRDGFPALVRRQSGSSYPPGRTLERTGGNPGVLSVLCLFPEWF